MTASELAVGCVGAGGMGAFRIAALATQTSGARAAAVADLDTARAAEAAQLAGAAGSYGDPLQLIQDPEGEAVLIASPPAAHPQQVLACLEAGKPVLCKKPLAMTASDCFRIIEAEVDGGHQLVQLGFMPRFDPELYRSQANP